MYKLSDDLEAQYNGNDDSITFDQQVENLAGYEVRELLNLYLDGRCPVCCIEIPLNDVVCDTCFEQAAVARR